ncbi:MAG: hypothetical protein KPEEDBHJ_01286 [Anaerolineales bacterium]|nr:hypothetical protein [Anaerolineales bacterium]
MHNTGCKAIVLCLVGLLSVGCFAPSKPTATPTPNLPGATSAPATPEPISFDVVRYVSAAGDDLNPGTQEAPWLTMKKAVASLLPGETLVVRGGIYEGVHTGWSFAYSGAETQPITVTNQPGEQVVFQMPTVEFDDRYIFRCSVNPVTPAEWQTTKADYIRIIGSDVSPQILSNGVESRKGIVMQGLEGEQSPAIFSSDCDHWEVAGVDFVDVAYGISTKKNNWRSMEERSPDYWYVHDNRVYGYYRESGMQFNGSFNVVENNEIYKVSDRLDTPFGCQLLNLLGNNNIVRGNTFSRMGSDANCLGLMFEWDLADLNLIENNRFLDVPVAISIQGGDGNIIINNYFEASRSDARAGVVIASYDDRSGWPCNEPDSISPPDNPAHPEYGYYYPHDCHSKNNQIAGNTFVGFELDWVMQPVSVDSNIFAENISR